MLKEFKKFILRGNLVDLAIGFTVGSAFTAFAKSMVNDIIMPPVSLLVGSKDFSSRLIILKQGNPPGPYSTTAKAAQSGAVTVNYGIFLNNLFALLIIAAAMFAIIKIVNKFDDEILQVGSKKRKIKKNDPSNKKCPYCFQTIDFRATRCNFCTSQLPTK
jgi:large conductance mechanosensitive channel